MVTWGNNTTATFGKGTSAAASTTPSSAAPPATGFGFGAQVVATTHPSTPPAASQPAPSLNPPPIIIGNTTFQPAAAPAAGGGLFGSNPGMFKLIFVLWGIVYSISVSLTLKNMCTSCVHFCFCHCLMYKQLLRLQPVCSVHLVRYNDVL